MQDQNQEKKTAEYQDLMLHCLEIAENALPEDVPVGALILKNGEIISQAHNRREIDNNPVGHAEILALQEAAKKLGSWRLNDCTLIVSLEPCPMCASAIAQSRIPSIVFGAYDPVEGSCGSQYNLFKTQKTEIIGGILEEPCAKVLRDFFREQKRGY